MKKFLFWCLMAALAVIFTTALAQAQTWYPANQKTIAWDAVTKLADGTAIPAGSTVQYRIYIVSSADATKANPIDMGTVTTTSTTLTFTTEGNYFIGVKAERMVAGAKVGESAITWSDSAAGTQGGATFGIISYKPPAPAGGLRTQQ